MDNAQIHHGEEILELADRFGTILGLYHSHCNSMLTGVWIIFPSTLLPWPQPNWRSHLENQSMDLLKLWPLPSRRQILVWCQACDGCYHTWGCWRITVDSDDDRHNHHLNGMAHPLMCQVIYTVSHLSLSITQARGTYLVVLKYTTTINEFCCPGFAGSVLWTKKIHRTKLNQTMDWSIFWLWLPKFGVIPVAGCLIFKNLTKPFKNRLKSVAAG